MVGRVLVLTDRTQATRPLVEVVAAAVDEGAAAVLLREKDLPRDERRAMAEALLAVVGDARLLIASDAELARELGLGVHLAARELGSASLVGVSCHDDAELARAAAMGADYATLSPIFESRSKPGYGPALGPEALSGAPLPVYALGGIEPGRATACVRAGAAGVAVMGAVMREPGVVRRLLAELRDSS